jgi:putative redox protein
LDQIDLIGDLTADALAPISSRDSRRPRDGRDIRLFETPARCHAARAPHSAIRNEYAVLSGPVLEIGRQQVREPPEAKGYDAAVKKRSTTLVHEGGMRFAAETGTGRRLTFGDEAERNELSPVETVAAALAACSAMDVVSILAKKRQVLDSYRIDIRADQRGEYPQVFTRIDLTHIVEGTVVLEAAVRRAIELSAAKYCPVNAMLSAGATEIHHHFRMRCTSVEPQEASGEVIVTGPERQPDIVA